MDQEKTITQDDTLKMTATAKPTPKQLTYDDISVGTPFRFRSGGIYAKAPDGSLRNLGKPVVKAERKAKKALRKLGYSNEQIAEQLMALSLSAAKEANSNVQ